MGAKTVYIIVYPLDTYVHTGYISTYSMYRYSVPVATLPRCTLYMVVYFCTKTTPPGHLPQFPVRRYHYRTLSLYYHTTVPVARLRSSLERVVESDPVYDTL
jgi:hypothetical protein